MTEPRAVRLDQIAPFTLAPGALGRPLFGAEAMLNLVELEPGAVVAQHDHPHEQLTLVLAGAITMDVAGTIVPLRPMEALVLPSGIRHGGTAMDDGCTVLDVFAPPREDYRATWSAALAPAD